MSLGQRELRYDDERQLRENDNQNIETIVNERNQRRGEPNIVTSGSTTLKEYLTCYPRGDKTSSEESAKYNKIKEIMRSGLPDRTLRRTK